VNKKPKTKAGEAENPGLETDEVGKLLREIERDYCVSDPAGLIYINQAREALKRMRQAQIALERDGISVVDRYGQIKMHPAATVEKNSRLAMFKALAALHLDVEPLKNAAGRPPGK